MCEVIAFKYLGCLYVEFIRNRSRIGWNESGLLYNSISWLDPSVRSFSLSYDRFCVCVCARICVALPRWCWTTRDSLITHGFNFNALILNNLPENCQKYIYDRQGSDRVFQGEYHS